MKRKNIEKNTHLDGTQESINIEKNMTTLSNDLEIEKNITSDKDYNLSDFNKRRVQYQNTIHSSHKILADFFHDQVKDKLNQMKYLNEKISESIHAKQTHLLSESIAQIQYSTKIISDYTKMNKYSYQRIQQTIPHENLANNQDLIFSEHKENIKENKIDTLAQPQALSLLPSAITESPNNSENNLVSHTTSLSKNAIEITDESNTTSTLQPANHINDDDITISVHRKADDNVDLINEEVIQVNNDFLYHDNDIVKVFESRLIEEINKNLTLAKNKIEILGSTQLHVNVNINSPKAQLELFLEQHGFSDTILFIPICIGEHWVGLRIIIESGKISKLKYYNSKDSEDSITMNWLAVQDNLKSLKVLNGNHDLSHISLEIHDAIYSQPYGDDTNCAPFLIENMLVDTIQMILGNNQISYELLDDQNADLISLNIAENIRRKQLKSVQKHDNKYFEGTDTNPGFYYRQLHNIKGISPISKQLQFYTESTIASQQNSKSPENTNANHSSSTEDIIVSSSSTNLSNDNNANTITHTVLTEAIQPLANEDCQVVLNKELTNTYLKSSEENEVINSINQTDTINHKNTNANFTEQSQLSINTTSLNTQNFFSEIDDIDIFSSQLFNSPFGADDANQFAVNQNVNSPDFNNQPEINNTNIIDDTYNIAPSLDTINSLPNQNTNQSNNQVVHSNTQNFHSEIDDIDIFSSQLFNSPFGADDANQFVVNQNVNPPDFDNQPEINNTNIIDDTYNVAQSLDTINSLSNENTNQLNNQVVHSNSQNIREKVGLLHISSLLNSPSDHMNPQSASVIDIQATTISPIATQAQIEPNAVAATNMQSATNTYNATNAHAQFNVDKAPQQESRKYVVSNSVPPVHRISGKPNTHKNISQHKNISSKESMVEVNEKRYFYFFDSRHNAKKILNRILKDQAKISMPSNNSDVTMILHPELNFNVFAYEYEEACQRVGSIENLNQYELKDYSQPTVKDLTPPDFYYYFADLDTKYQVPCSIILVPKSAVPKEAKLQQLNELLFVHPQGDLIRVYEHEEMAKDIANLSRNRNFKPLMKVLHIAADTFQYIPFSEYIRWQKTINSTHHNEKNRSANNIPQALTRGTANNSNLLNNPINNSNTNYNVNNVNNVNQEHTNRNSTQRLFSHTPDGSLSSTNKTNLKRRNLAKD